MPRITVSMAARNVDQYIETAIASVLQQTFGDFELVVVDDESSDGTADAVGRFDDPRVRLIRYSSHLGIGASHNRVLENSDSELVVHVDADDIVRPDAFRQVAATMSRSPAAPGAHCYFDFIDDHGRALSNRFTRARIGAQLRRQVDSDDQGRAVYVAGGRPVPGPRQVLVGLGEQAHELLRKLGDPDTVLERLGRVY